jgi:hypothetical protein
LIVKKIKKIKNMQMSSVTFEEHVKKDKATLSGLGLVKVTFFFLPALYFFSKNFWKCVLRSLAYLALIGTALSDLGINRGIDRVEEQSFVTRRVGEGLCVVDRVLGCF